MDCWWKNDLVSHRACLLCTLRYNPGVSPRLCALLFLATLGLAVSAQANPESAALRAKGYALAYDLDHDEALAVLKQAVAADPNDAAAYRGVATILWLNILFRRGATTIDDYLGRARPTMRMLPPPPELVSMFYDYARRSLTLGENQVAASRASADAHYQVGASVGLLASFDASVQGRVLSGFRAARRAYDEHERALALDPTRKDAGLVVGTYRYVVSTLPAPMRLMAYVAGFGGGRERGIAMLEEAAEYPSDVQVDARFALAIIYNRERRYTDALRIIAGLQRQYPRNRLLWLAAGGTALRAGRAMEAVNALDQGFTKLADDRRPRMFGEEALWRYHRGAAFVALRRTDVADRELRTGLAGEARDWVRGRLHLELGKLADLAGDRSRASTEYRTAVNLFQRDNDNIGLLEATRYLKTAYR